MSNLLPNPKWFLPAVIVFCLMFMWCVLAFGYSDNEIVSAIGKAENSQKYPYGIKSINTHSNKEYARQICLNSVRNGRMRWIKAGKPDDLIVFIGKRYSPPRENPNWVRLVKYFLANKNPSTSE